MLTALERAAPLRPDGEDAVLLDIGANLGTYSVMAAAFGYPVRAFEAMPRNVAAIHQTLCWNADLSERVTVFPYGLAEEEAACAVVVASFNVANGLLACTDEQLHGHEDFEVAGHTHTVRLGDYLGAVRSDVMKMDVEGFEPMVLRSAGVYLPAPPLTWPTHVPAHRATASQLMLGVAAACGAYGNPTGREPYSAPAAPGRRACVCHHRPMHARLLPPC